MDSIEQLNHILGLVMRHFNSIIAGLENDPREISPYWSTMTYDGDEQEYDDAESWAYGFVEGMRLCWNDWQPLLSAPQGHAWFRPIALLGEDDFSVDQDELTKTPAMRAELALQIPQAVLDMHAHWLPLRLAVYQREVAKSMQPKVWDAMSLAPAAAARSTRSAVEQRVICIKADRPDAIEKPGLPDPPLRSAAPAPLARLGAVPARMPPRWS